MSTYPAPGRGAWRTTGGLLPGKPGGTGTVGYYRLAVATEAPVGSTWITKADTSHHAECVWLGVKALQQLIGAQADGWFGPQTSLKLIAAQKRWGIEADGIAGPTTLKAALTETITTVAATAGVPVALLGGLLVHESGLDPAAVGVNGIDHGLAQINLSAHAAEVTAAKAMDTLFALQFSAEDLSHIHTVWDGKTKADPWDVAIANHNSPKLARQWAIAGVPPFVPGRVFQIEDYVLRVRESW